MLPAVGKKLARRLGLVDEDLEFAFCDHVAENLRPASNELTDKGRFAEFLPGHQTRTVRSLPGKPVAIDEPCSEDCRDAGVWFLKKVGTGLARGVTVHESLGAAAAAADRARGQQHNSWYSDGVHLGVESSTKAEYVIQKAVASPRLWNGRKVHFRLYLFAVSPPAASGASSLRAALGLPQQPADESEQLSSAERLETRWYLNEHVWLAAADEVWTGPMSTDRGSQLSSTRTAELRNVDHEVLWPVLRKYAERFVADARRCVERDQLTPRQQECLAMELLGLDVIVSEDMKCTALEVNSGPRQCAAEDDMQYSMYEIAFGLECSPIDQGMRWLELGNVGTPAVMLPYTGKVAVWAGVSRVREPTPATTPRRAPRATASVHTKSSPSTRMVAAASGQQVECIDSNVATGTLGDGARRKAVGDFMANMPEFI